MLALAPTSTPTVGESEDQDPRLGQHHLASTIFC